MTDEQKAQKIKHLIYKGWSENDIAKEVGCLAKYVRSIRALTLAGLPKDEREELNHKRRLRMNRKTKIKAKIREELKKSYVCKADFLDEFQARVYAKLIEYDNSDCRHKKENLMPPKVEINHLEWLRKHAPESLINRGLM